MPLLPSMTRSMRRRRIAQAPGLTLILARHTLPGDQTGLALRQGIQQFRSPPKMPLWTPECALLPGWAAVVFVEKPGVDPAATPRC